MSRVGKVLFFYTSMFIGVNMNAQDSLVKRDTNQFYKDVAVYSTRNRFTKLMYRAIFKPIKSTPAIKKPKKKVSKSLLQKPYSNFEGKTIRHIIIQTLDPFGYSIKDTMVRSLNKINRTGNALHIKSGEATIKNLLLVHANDPFDSLLYKESERLVRSRSYVRDVSFFVKSTSKNSDSVDIFIRLLDKWSIIPKFGVSISNITIKLIDKNIGGLGQEFQLDYTGYFDGKDNLFNSNYLIPNIRNSYVSVRLHYKRTGEANFARSVAIDRPFFSPFAKWAAGVIFDQQLYLDSIRITGENAFQQKFRYNLQDYWAGGAIKVFKGNTEDSRTTNFITSVRYLHLRYLERPSLEFDTLNIFSNENFYLLTVGLSTRKFVQDRFIFGYGLTEDVPIGRVFSLNGGYQLRGNLRRLYLGTRISYGKYYSWGYLNPILEYGSFFHKSKSQQAVISCGVIYFTGLYEMGKWRVRQFVKPQLTLGIRRFSYDSITLNDGAGIDGYNSPSLSGTSRMLFTSQTQLYAPWSWAGFKFGPYLVCSLGRIGNPNRDFENRWLYTAFGLGVLIKNENLVFGTFQFSFSFYPVIPDVGNNIFKWNSFGTKDFNFRDFEIGKPAITAFN
jgi:hypothetical protein